ncbi:anthranilate synthase component II [Tepidibacter sp. Z1-5]|uniref:anthranilate synthase component II n=1 Tax=Tepidibacter sp. Z1-5 TaxID=3134138 RepID=UPI0030C04ADB
MIVIIDNYDSFTYNLYQYIGEINPDVRVFRNDAIKIEELMKMDIKHIIISPGPGFPSDSGISKDVIKKLGKDIPVLGVCLGHQAIGEVFGGKIVHANKMIHGKTSMIKHNETDLFKDVQNPLEVTRYHSLVVEKNSISDELIITAQSSDGEIMGLKHKKYPIYGLQFHPESISTKGGKKILKNFLEL